MVDLSLHAGGIVLPVRAQAGGGKDAIRGEQNGQLKISVTQVAEKGKANKAIVDVLAKGLGLKRSQIELLAGQTSPQKRFLVRDISLGDLALRIATALDNLAS
jgi:uncharacterized protein (TIGR00251 family)